MSSAWFFVDCEACGPSVSTGTLTEFGIIHYKTGQSFHGVIYERRPNPDNPATALMGDLITPPDIVFRNCWNWIQEHSPNRAIMISDNPAYDFQWINDGFHQYIPDTIPVEKRNPFGHSARRISDYYAGLTGDFTNTQRWKRLRVTPHDHNPVHDCQGNVEAFRRIQAGER